MSGRNAVTVILDAIDKLSPVLKGIQGQTQNLGAGAVFMGNMYTKAFEMASSAAGSLINRFGEAADMQTSAIGLAGQFSAMTGKSYEAAGEMIKGMTADFSQMAAKLPGATQDYKNLGLAISDTLIKANTVNGVFNEAAYKKQTMSLTETLGLIKATNSAMQTSDLQLYFTKFAEGATKAELSTLKLHTDLPGLEGELEKASKKLYGEGKKIEDLTLAQRTKIMEVATRALAPEEMIRDLEKTASSQIESFKTTLFDQDTGIFGFLRSVTTVNGKSKTVMDGFAALLTEIFGADGLFATVGEALGFMGLNMGDPMLNLYNGLMTLKDWAVSASDFLRAQNFPDLTKLNASELGKTLADSIDSMLNGLGNAIKSLDWASILIGTDKLLDSLVSGIGSFFANLDWTTYLFAGLAVVGGVLAAGILATVVGAIGAAIATIGGVPLLVIAGVGLLAIAAAKAITDNMGIITGFFVGVWDNIKNTAVGLFTGAIGLLTGVITSAKDAAFNAVSSFVSTVGSSISNLMSEIGNWFNQQISQVKSVLNNPVANAIGTVQSVVTGVPVPNFASGLNAGGLLSAISAESRAMPSGAGIAIANTSETILNRSQQADLVASLSRTKSNSGVFAPQIMVNPSPGMDTKALANMVLSELDARWKQYQLASV